MYRDEVEAEKLDIVFEGLGSNLAAHGLDRESAAQAFHVVRRGERLSGLDAFLVLWATLPRWAWLARLIDRPVIRPVAGVVYDRVAAPVLYAMDRRRRRKARA